MTIETCTLCLGEGRIRWCSPLGIAKGVACPDCVGRTKDIEIRRLRDIIRRGRDNAAWLPSETMLNALHETCSE